MGIDLHTLGNGIRLVHKRLASPVAHCCIMINAGTRDELKHEHGLAHFIEHVLFKGTQRRRAYHIMSRMEDVGGELNAYTTKEETVIHATMLREEMSRGMELLADILFRSVFPDKELQREKEIVIDEINSYRDNPSELIYDDFEDLIYQGHPFGRNILGSRKCIRQFTRAHVEGFMARHYLARQMVFCSIGDIPFERIKRLADKHFGAAPARDRDTPRTPINGYTPRQHTAKRSTFQQHCMIGCRAYELVHPKRVGLQLLSNILGGPGLNSRLNLSLRERHGFAYNVEATYTPYSDTGLFSIYFGTDREHFERAVSLVHSELKTLRAKKLGVMQLHKAKRQLIGQLAIASENSEVQMLNLARSVLMCNSPGTLQDLTHQINSLTAQALLEVANQVLAPEHLSTLTYV